MMANHPPVGAVKPLEDSDNEITEAAIEDVGAGEEHGRGHDASGKVVYPHRLGLHDRDGPLPEEDTAVPEHLQRFYKNFNHNLKEFGKVEPRLRYFYLKLKFAKDLLALVGYLNSKISPFT